MFQINGQRVNPTVNVYRRNLICQLCVTFVWLNVPPTETFTDTVGLR